MTQLEMYILSLKLYSHIRRKAL